MQLDPETCYRAVQARDPRFDGRFFTAVLTTGIFCRPVCPARTPHRANVRFYTTSAAAASAGFRPCLRCRPEIAPSGLPWLGTANTVVRALRLLETGRSEDLENQLGISERHLRRLFHQHLGVSPRDVESTSRVLLAKTLITDTALPLTEVAFAAGYNSVRRFNDAIRKFYKRNPTEIRRSRAASDPSALELDLSYVPPYDWDRFQRFLRPRLIPELESVEDGVLRRRLHLEGDEVRLEIEHVPERRAFRVRLGMPDVSRLRQAVERVRTFLDLRCDPAMVEQHLRGHIRVPPGLRLIGTWDRFEAAVRAVLGQQVSVKAATTLAGRLCQRFGSFPNPVQLADGNLAGIGLTSRRAETLQRMSEAIASGAAGLQTADAIARLTEVPGIGPWTVEYIALRCGEPDAFPSGDLVLKNYKHLAEAWRPWRSYAAMAIWTMEAGNAVASNETGLARRAVVGGVGSAWAGGLGVR